MARGILHDAVGSKVAVWIGEGSRNSFATAISVCGILEHNPEADQYRIVVDIGTYCYFFFEDVHSILLRQDGTFKDGATMVISLYIKPTELPGLDELIQMGATDLIV